MKYIIIRVHSGGEHREWPVIFPENLIHSIMADAIKGYFADEASSVGAPTPKMSVVSAGFVEADVLQCYGKSDTLKAVSHPDDTRFINLISYNHGVR